MDDTQRKIYDFIESKYIRSFEHNPSGTVKDMLNKAKLIRLRQAAVNIGLLTRPIEDAFDTDSIGSTNKAIESLPDEFQDDSEIISKITDYRKEHIPPKFKCVYELISNKILLKNGKVIVWTIFVQNAKGLKEFLEDNDIKSRLLIGEVGQVDREEVVGKFNNPNNNDFRVVIANPFSVSESISLHKGCHNAIYMERDYNCASFIQSKNRIHRKGLTSEQDTNYYYILSNNSIDVIIHDKLDAKVDRMNNVINSEIPLFNRIDDGDETDIIKTLIRQYAEKT
jgi:SNF2 family DNA or RNA helicase